MTIKSANNKTIAVLGAGIQGTCASLCLAERGYNVVLIDREPQAMSKASLWNEGKIHLGFLFANDAAGRTARTMIEGAERFLPILSRFISPSSIVNRRSKPFVYAIPHDSIISVEQIENHFNNVSQMLVQRGFSSKCYFDVDEVAKVHKLEATQFDTQFDRKEIRAAFQTPEVSIDTFQIASDLRNAIYLHPKIELRSSTEIERVETSDAGREMTRVKTADGILENIQTDYIVNALWSDRLRLDIQKGLLPERDFRFRYKLALHLDNAVYPKHLNSTTLMLGAYGDLVTFPDDHIYLSWYPSCLQFSTDKAHPPRWDEWVSQKTKQKVYREVFQEMSKRIPSIGQIEVAEKDISIEGGTIFSWGNANISDTSDEVHERVNIGISNRGNYFSIDTGKYGMAPRFAEKLVEIIDDSCL